jgi:hypothetical protein
MKVVALPCICLLSLLTACSGWPSEPYANHLDTAVPSRTRRVQTPTPIVLSPTPLISTPQTGTAIPPSDTITPSALAASETPTTAAMATPATLRVDILGCDTGVDLLHGMGEVTNAYVTISNPTGADVPNMCATLRGLDEARPHPDKTKCFSTLPAGYQVTLKLTVDTTYKESTPIQVDVTSDDSLLMRTGKPACEAIGILLPDVGELGVLKPIPAP